MDLLDFRLQGANKVVAAPVDGKPGGGFDCYVGVTHDVTNAAAIELRALRTR